ncbi:hypothetical protein [Marinospirillum perlucidum]|uniref:hypothetical protein n=1 Tax=Marinospirillum perlucidum TaxID=1982602 RepID=UPI000DF35AB9|nr:hypothetical protein [Marinospirillum perlucidum]
MKNIKLVLALSGYLLLTGCLETEEEAFYEAEASPAVKITQENIAAVVAAAVVDPYFKFSGYYDTYNFLGDPSDYPSYNDFDCNHSGLVTTYYNRVYRSSYQQGYSVLFDFLSCSQNDASESYDGNIRYTYTLEEFVDGSSAQTRTLDFQDFTIKRYGNSTQIKARLNRVYDSQAYRTVTVTSDLASIVTGPAFERWIDVSVVTDESGGSYQQTRSYVVDHSELLGSFSVSTLSPLSSADTLYSMWDTELPNNGELKLQGAQGSYVYLTFSTGGIADISLYSQSSPVCTARVNFTEIQSKEWQCL